MNYLQRVPTHSGKIRIAAILLLAIAVVTLSIIDTYGSDHHHGASGGQSDAMHSHM